MALLSASWSARPWGGSSLRPPRGAVVESAWASRSRHSSAILWETEEERDEAIDMARDGEDGGKERFYERE